MSIRTLIVYLVSSIDLVTFSIGSNNAKVVDLLDLSQYW